MAHALHTDPRPSIVSDQGGSITVEWVGDRVLYARCVGSISKELARAHARRFDAMTAGAARISYFSDGSALTRYDMLGRSAFARFVLARPGRFKSITLLTADDAVTRVVEPLTQTLAGIVHVTTSREDFELSLLSEAPFALTASIFQNERRISYERAAVPLRSSIRPRHPYR
ncbi:MAG TPA: hypothetical protein VMI54_12825 [Polyangiaceae bacterium]|nr:hypothetical protein [Polyangiaceae bacterium]